MEPKERSREAFNGAGIGTGVGESRSKKKWLLCAMLAWLKMAASGARALSP